MKKYKYASLDIETLSTQSNAAVLTISAIAFDHDPIQTDRLDEHRVFTASISVADAMKHGVVDAGTLMWWMQQEYSAQQQAISGSELLGDALLRLYDWVQGSLTEDYMIVCNDVDFDKVIVHSAYQAVDISRLSPFNFSGGRHWLSLPTMEYLLKKVLHIPLQYHEPVLAHDSLEDAIAQARRAQQVLGALGILLDTLEDREAGMEQAARAPAIEPFLDWIGVQQFETYRDKTMITLGEDDAEEADLDETGSDGEGGEGTHQDSVGAP